MRWSLCLFVLTTPLLLGQPAGAPVAMVLSAKGECGVGRAGGDLLRARQMTLVHADDVVQVPEGGELVLVFLDDGRRERVLPDSHVTVRVKGCEPAGRVEKLDGPRVRSMKVLNDSLKSLPKGGGRFGGAVVKLMPPHPPDPPPPSGKKDVDPRPLPAPAAVPPTPAPAAPSPPSFTPGGVTGAAATASSQAASATLTSWRAVPFVLPVSPNRPSVTWRPWPNAEAYEVCLYAVAPSGERRLAWRGVTADTKAGYPKSAPPLPAGVYEWTVAGLRGPVRSPATASYVRLLDDDALAALREARDLEKAGTLGDRLLAAQLYDGAKAYGEALRVYESLATDNPREPMLQLRLADYYERAGRSADALAALRRARESDGPAEATEKSPR